MEDSIGFFLMLDYYRLGDNLSVAAVAQSILPLSSEHPDLFKFNYYDYLGYAYNRLNNIKDMILSWNNALEYQNSVPPMRVLWLKNTLAISQSNFESHKDAYKTFKALEQELQRISLDEKPDGDLLRLKSSILSSIVFNLYNLPNDPDNSQDVRAAVLRDYVSQALKASEGLLDGRYRLNALTEAVWAYYHLEDWQAYEQHVELLKVLAQSADYNALSTGAYRSIGLLSLRKGEYEQAAREFDTSLRLETRRQSRYNIIRAHLWLGHTYELAGRHDNALRAYSLAIATIDSSLNDIGTMDWGKNQTATWSRPYLGKMRQHLHFGHIRDAYATIANRSGRYLLTRHLQTTQPIDQETSERIDALYTRLKNVRAPQQTLSDQAARQTLKIQGQAIQAEIEALSTTGPPPRLDIDALQDHLAATGQTLIHFVLPEAYEPQGPYLRDRPEAKRGAFIVTRDTLSFVELTVHPDTLKHLLEKTSSLFASDQSEPKAPPQHVNLAGLAQLYDLLIRPLEPWLTSTDRLVIIPDGEAHRVPFAALVSGYTHDFAYDTADFLIEEFAITYSIIPHLYFYPALTSSTSGAKGVAFFGVQKEYTAPERSFQLPRLEEVDREGRGIEEHVRQVASFVGPDAHPSALLDRGLAMPILHVAAHARPDYENSLWSQIFLNPDSVFTDGILHLYDLEGQATTAQLLILSACNTRQGPVSSSEGMLGFHHAFHSMGIPSTIATLWEMDDAAASELFSSLYGPLADALPKDVALQQTMLHYLENAPLLEKSPYYWGGLMLTGATTPIELEPASPYAMWLLLFGSVCCLLGLGYLYNRRTANRL
ncbi:MAG: CHAT domain-containing protein [Bacteroidota bacterium]